MTNSTGPRGNIIVLGLDDSAKIYSSLDTPQVSTTRVFMYVITAILTFSLGVLAFYLA